MSDVLDFEPGGYRFVPSVFQYSAGVAALPGYRIRRETFANPLPVAEGFEMIEARFKAEGLPTTRFCACELRSPGQFTDAGFKAFNEIYVVTLRRWGIMDDGDINPVARSNVCPDIGAPPEPSFHAFSYVVEDDGGAAPSAVISGAPGWMVSSLSSQSPGADVRPARVQSMVADAMVVAAPHPSPSTSS